MTNEFLRRLNDIFQSLGSAIIAIQQIPIIQDALLQAQQAVIDAQNAADAANMAAVAAQAVADSAQADAAANAKEQALVNSYITPSSVVSATPSTVTIAPHTRHYADGTSVAVNGGSQPASASGDVDYVSYADPTRAGGTVSYNVTTSAPTQGMNVHVVGAVTVPTSGTQNGGSGPRRPGEVEP